ncbi:reticulocalbin-2 isoform X1 [Anguilla anguilla]|uniref:reticulocalbin-2 isoform X1 n=1 Tax=Anguilla anguilla TaxID=7936 RepID=UPI0015AFCA47|nr:reticulocalbin-2 isoform X1 [Anguilla anguilla]XP_035251610.1 reticulocalbin-2 isoform X1 [Anguilla anguilla]
MVRTSSVELAEVLDRGCCFRKFMNMKYTAVTFALFALSWGSVESNHKAFHEDHFLGEQHNPEHDINVLLGNQGEDDIKKLSPDELKRRMVEIVKKIDTDTDTFLTAEEITLWIQRVYRQYALEDAEERFPEFDTNKDDVVSWDEYNLVVHGHVIDLDNNMILEDPEEESVRFLHLKEKKRFDFADGDGIPGLNLREFLAFTHPSEVDEMADFTIEDVLNEFDKDNDGLISIKEFLGDIRSNAEDQPSQWEIEETIRFQQLYDQDKDGQLNRDEQLRWVAPNSYSSAREEAIHLIKEMDQDGDGRLSEAEILKNMQLFMSSEVTDYGRQLQTTHDEL